MACDLQHDGISTLAFELIVSRFLPLGTLCIRPDLEFGSLHVHTAWGRHMLMCIYSRPLHGITRGDLLPVTRNRRLAGCSQHDAHCAGFILATL